MDPHVTAPHREGLLDRVFHESALGMAVARLDDGEVLEANDAFSYLIGRGVPDLLGTDVFALGLWSDVGVERAKEMLRTRGVIDGFDTTVRPSDGETRVIRLWAELVEGDAFTTLRETEDTFDLVFLDSEKEGYEALFALARPLLEPGGLVVADNVLSHADTLEAYSAARQADPTLSSVTVPLDRGLELTVVLTEAL